MLILGTNLTQDRLVRLATLVPGAVLRAVTVDTVPGGKPVNVARAARALGGRPTLVANCPGVEGVRLADLLTEGGLAIVTVRTAGTLRTATIVLEGDGRTTVINEPGPPLDDAGRTGFLDAYVDTMAGQRPQVVVASGSLPPGAPADLYAAVVRLAVEHGAIAVVDAGGPVLAAALRAGPALVKPNLAEAESALGLRGDGARVTSGDARPRALAAAEALLRRARDHRVVTAAPPAPPSLRRPGEPWVPAPRMAEVRDPIGAGDVLLSRARGGARARRGVGRRHRRGWPPPRRASAPDRRRARSGAGSGVGGSDGESRRRGREGFGGAAAPSSLH